MSLHSPIIEKNHIQQSTKKHIISTSLACESEFFRGNRKGYYKIERQNGGSGQRLQVAGSYHQTLAKAPGSNQSEMSKSERGRALA